MSLGRFINYNRDNFYLPLLPCALRWKFYFLQPVWTEVLLLCQFRTYGRLQGQDEGNRLFWQL